MLRRLSSVLIALGLASATITPVVAAEVCVPALQFQNSIYNPGGPLLTPILNNWLYWGNAFNWAGNNGCVTVPAGQYSSTYNAPAYPVQLSAGSKALTYANYTSVAPVQNSWDANYSNTPAVANSWNANYSPTVVTKNWNANYTQVISQPNNWNANYSPTVVTKNWNANYTPAETVINWNANYSPTVVEKKWDANYSPTIVEKNWDANYSASPSAQREWTANYSRTPATQNRFDAEYSGTSSRSANIIYPTGGTTNHYANVTAPYQEAQPYSGAAFGSLFGDGRDPAFEGTAAESFVARLKGQTATNYTMRGDSLSSQDYNSFFDVNPVTTYNPVTAYDRSFTGSAYGNLNATPTTAPSSSSGAVGATVRDVNLAVPIQQNSTYTKDLQTLESRGILPASWKNRTAQTALNREDIAQLLVLLRGWRDTGTPTSIVRSTSFTTLLPVITDMKPTDELYFTFVILANERILYMPEMVQNKGALLSVKADPKGAAMRAQTLQAIMTALYLRPNTMYSNAGYTDLPQDAWYTQWALTARSYGLNYGTSFRYEQTVTQEEAVHMVATLLQQIR